MDRQNNNLLKEKFRLFYDKYAAGFLHFIRKACGGDPVLADDIFQESFFRLFRSSPPGLNEHQLKSWLYTTAYRLVIDEQRKKREARVEMDLMTDDSFSRHPENLPDDMEAVFSRLLVKDRALLWMAHVEGYTHKEISEITGIKEKSLRVILYRIRKKFAEGLRKAGYQGG